jgi:hypothetical protein
MAEREQMTPEAAAEHLEQRHIHVCDLCKEAAAHLRRLVALERENARLQADNERLRAMTVFRDEALEAGDGA